MKCENAQAKFWNSQVGGVRLSVVWEALADLLVVLTTLDTAVVGQTVLQEHWRLYKKMIKGLRHEPDKFGAEISQVGSLYLINYL